MVFLQCVFWLCICIIFYNYAGYAVIIFFLNRIRKKTAAPVKNTLPSVSFIVAAYNEEDVIEQKVENCLSLNYPQELIEYIFITDGSTDRTPLLVAKYPQVKLLHADLRKGKSAAINRAVLHASNEVLIFNDANTILNTDAVLNIAKHYSSSAIGGVAGEKKVITAGNKRNETTGNEGLYWKYESFLKQLDSDFYSVVGAAGELFSLRRELYEPVAENIILDDFIISMKVVKRGYRVVYEKNACASELPSASIKDEKKRKIRIAAGGFQSIVLLKDLLYFWRYPRVTFLYVSHRLLRWTLTPVSLMVAFLVNWLLAFFSGTVFWNTLFLLQIGFYGLALIGYFAKGNNKWLKIPRVTYYFVFMNVSVVLGFFRLLKGKQSAVWDKAKRAV